MSRSSGESSTSASITSSNTSTHRTIRSIWLGPVIWKYIRLVLFKDNFLEKRILCKEELRDLLEAESNKKLEIKERPDGGVYVKELTVSSRFSVLKEFEKLQAKLTRSVAEIQEVMARGNGHRSVG